MSIFISIASYRDSELINTINDALEKANNPEQLFFGLVIQDKDRSIPDLSHVLNIKIIKVHPKDARGVGYARALAMDLYDGEDYYLQVDSHTRFVKGWDDECIKQLKKSEGISNHKKVILSYFPAPYIIEGKKVHLPQKLDKQKPYPTVQIPIQNKQKEWTAERVEFSDSQRLMPELSKTVLGGFIFSSGAIVKDVPYDPEISFFGEEICFAMRAWTRGWDIYSPPNNIVYHFYIRNDFPKVWTDRNIRKISWSEIQSISKDKQKNVLCGIEQGTYGAGNVRSLEQYETFININFKEIYGLTK